MKQINDKALILKRIDYQEKDRIITILGEKTGKMSLIAKSVRGPKSKLAGSVELFSLIGIQFVEGRGELGTLTGARLLEHYHQLVADLNKMVKAAECLRVIDKICDKDNGKEYFLPVWNTLRALDDLSFDEQIVWTWFCVQVLSISGVMPEKPEVIDGNNFDFDSEKQKFISAEGGQLNRNDLKLFFLLGSLKKPIKIKNQEYSALRLSEFADRLLKTNLTEV